MALSILDLPDYLTYYIRVRDIQGQPMSVSGFLTAHSDDNLVNEVQDNFGSFLEDIETVCAVKIDYARLDSVVAWSWTSDKTAQSTQFATVDQVAVLNFERANPLKPGLKLNENFPLFAPKVGTAVLDFPNAGVVKTATTAVADIIDYLTKRLTSKYSGNGLLYNGFTFILPDSGVVSVPDIVNNQ